jgi:hypothetical protein
MHPRRTAHSRGVQLKLRQVIAFIAHYGLPLVVAIILTLIAAAVVIFRFWRGSKNKNRTWTSGERLFERAQSLSRAGQHSAKSRLRAARHRN